MEISCWLSASILTGNPPTAQIRFAVMLLIVADHSERIDSQTSRPLFARGCDQCDTDRQSPKIKFEMLRRIAGHFLGSLTSSFIRLWYRLQPSLGCILEYIAADVSRDTAVMRQSMSPCCVNSSCGGFMTTTRKCASSARGMSVVLAAGAFALCC
jgi:hypothetical protein